MDVCHVKSHTVISACPLAMLACLHSTQPRDEQDIKSSFLLSISHCSQVKSKEVVINSALRALDSITVIDQVLTEYRVQIAVTVTRGKLGTDLHFGRHQLNFFKKKIIYFIKLNFEILHKYKNEFILKTNLCQTLKRLISTDGGNDSYIFSVRHFVIE